MHLSGRDLRVRALELLCHSEQPEHNSSACLRRDRGDQNLMLGTKLLMQGPLCSELELGYLLLKANLFI